MDEPEAFFDAEEEAEQAGRAVANCLKGSPLHKTAFEGDVAALRKHLGASTRDQLCALDIQGYTVGLLLAEQVFITLRGHGRIPLASSSATGSAPGCLTWPQRVCTRFT